MASVPAPAPATSSGAPARDLFLPLVAAGFLICLVLIPFELDRITGLPAHPLLLHVPVIFVPLTAVAAIVVAFHARWRQRYGELLAGSGLIALAGTVLAVGAGEKWRDQGEGGPNIAHHAALGEQLRIIAFVFVALLLIRLVLDRRRVAMQGAAAIAMSLALVVSGAVAAIWTYRTGHAGAERVFGERGGGPPGGGAGFGGPGQGP